MLNLFNLLNPVVLTITLDTGIGAQIFESVITVFQFIIIAAGALVAIVGAVNFFEGRGDDDGAKVSKGRNQLISGAGMIVIAIVSIPLLSGIF